MIKRDRSCCWFTVSLVIAPPLPSERIEIFFYKLIMLSSSLFLNLCSASIYYVCAVSFSQEFKVHDMNIELASFPLALQQQKQPFEIGWTERIVAQSCPVSFSEWRWPRIWVSLEQFNCLSFVTHLGNFGTEIQTLGRLKAANCRLYKF